MGNKRVFACAVEWPGWCRSGKTQEEALKTLASYAGRYASVATRAGRDFAVGNFGKFKVGERLTGNATTDFGAPGILAKVDGRPSDVEDGRRLRDLVEAAWSTFAAVVAAAPSQLRKGPRGGGRDRDQIASHVIDAELSYIRKIGLRFGQDDIERARQRTLEVIGAASDGGPVIERGWPVRYAARRIAWHVLDHAWEIEDKSVPA
ncbi:MAG: hypothetical protein ACT4OP_06805 [Actinomycetota bacterium]